MRISDWSSDVCSSDLQMAVAAEIDVKLQRADADGQRGGEGGQGVFRRQAAGAAMAFKIEGMGCRAGQHRGKIGRASCRERVCQYVSISVVAGTLKKKRNTIVVLTYHTIKITIT